MSQSFTFEGWFNALPSVNIETLDQDSKSCDICRVEYSPSSSPPNQQGDPVEKPVRLPCGHIFGEQCLKEWLAPAPEGAEKNTCPKCRLQLGARDANFEENLRHLQWLEALDYAEPEHRNLVLGSLVHRLSEQDSRRVFRERVLLERQRQRDILQMRREILRLEHVGAELRIRLERETQEIERVEQEYELQIQELRFVSHVIEHEILELRRSIQQVDGEARAAALAQLRVILQREPLPQEWEDELQRLVDMGPQERGD